MQLSTQANNHNLRKYVATDEKYIIRTMGQETVNSTIYAK